jgi:hypothetical protein
MGLFYFSIFSGQYGAYGSGCTRKYVIRLTIRIAANSPVPLRALGELLFDLLDRGVFDKIIIDKIMGRLTLQIPEVEK